MARAAPTARSRAARVPGGSASLPRSCANADASAADGWSLRCPVSTTVQPQATGTPAAAVRLKPASGPVPPAAAVWAVMAAVRLAPAGRLAAVSCADLRRCLPRHRVHEELRSRRGWLTAAHGHVQFGVQAQDPSCCARGIPTAARAARTRSRQRAGCRAAARRARPSGGCPRSRPPRCPRPGRRPALTVPALRARQAAVGFARACSGRTRAPPRTAGRPARPTRPGPDRWLAATRRSARRARRDRGRPSPSC